MNKLLIVMPLFFIGCVSSKTHAKVLSTLEEAQKTAVKVQNEVKKACELVLYKERNASVEQLRKCEKSRNYWMWEYKELVNPK